MEFVVAYYRVSTDRQGKSMLGLEAQQESVCRYTQAKHLDLIKEFTEVEGAGHSNRPVLKKALAYCRKHNARLLIAKLDRLGRSVAFISSLMESNVKFVAVDFPDANELMLHIMAAFAEYERKQISIRTKEALTMAKRRGIKLGEQGKILSQQNKHRADEFALTLKPVIDKLKRQGFTSVRQIAQELNRLKVPTFHSGCLWHKTSVHNLLVRSKGINDNKGV